VRNATQTESHGMLLVPLNYNNKTIS